MSWLILGVAVITEITWALSLKWAATVATWQASSVPIVLSFVNMGLLALAMRGLPAGTAYAIWTGAGAFPSSTDAIACRSIDTGPMAIARYSA